MIYLKLKITLQIRKSVAFGGKPTLYATMCGCALTDCCKEKGQGGCCGGCCGGCDGDDKEVCILGHWSLHCILFAPPHLSLHFQHTNIYLTFSPAGGPAAWTPCIQRRYIHVCAACCNPTHNAQCTTPRNPYYVYIYYIYCLKNI